MKDGTGREIDYMRISITDRCNLRCKYCMPDGAPCTPGYEILSLEEIQAAAAAAAGLGIRRVRVTGGEPLVRKGCPSLIRMLKETPGIESVTMTTNGILLEQHLDELLDAGLDGVNISLDTLDAGLYREITGQPALESVLRIVRRARELPIPVKINAVSIDFGEMAEQAGLDCDTGWRPLAELARQYPVDVRFIELMPIGFGRQFRTLDHRRLLEEMEKAYPGLKKDERRHGFGPAVYYRIPGFLGSVGLISAIHGKFCSSCNRIRLTAGGYLKTCLCYEDGTDLRAVLRGKEGESQKQLSEAIRQAILKKPGAHCFETPGEITESHNMISIGG